MEPKSLQDTNVMRGIDPGPRRRAPRSTLSCCVQITLAVSLAISIYICVFIWQKASPIIENTRRPHKGLYYNTSLEISADKVVRPLVDRNSTFDIVATVWVRAPVQEEEAYKAERNGSASIGSMDSESTKLATADFATKAETPFSLEYPIFSGSIFQGLHLSSKDIHTDVNLTIPIRRLRRDGRNLKQDDVRASFVLIPSESKVLPYLVNFSTWDNLGSSRKHMRPLPGASIGSPINTTGLGGRSLVDQALDSFGVSAPLVEFVSTAGSCPRSKPVLSNISTVNGSSESALPGILNGSDILSAANANATLSPGAGTRNLSIHLSEFTKSHPHIITRTQLRIVNEDAILNRLAYEMKHHLTQAICGRQDPTSPLRNVAFSNCQRDYNTLGHIETQFNISTPLEDGTNQTEYFYAPFLSTLRSSAGVLDLVSVPGLHDTCEASRIRLNNSSTLVSEDAEGLSEYHSMPNDSQVPGQSDPSVQAVNVTWHVSFSGRSPAKLFVADQFSKIPHRPQMANATTSERHSSHDWAELLHGLLGHRFYPDAHPRRRLASTIISGSVIVLAFLLEMQYWYTCASTVGIALRAQIVALLSQLCEELMIVGEYWTNDGLDLFGLIFSTALWALFFMPMARAIFRLEVDWRGWLPVVRRAKATHLERASSRLEARTKWSLISAITAVLFILYFGVQPQEYKLIEARINSEPSGSASWIPQTVLTLRWILPQLSEILQIIMNARSGTFAGHSRAGSILRMLGVLSDLVVFTPFVGRYDQRPALYWGTVTQYAVLVVVGLQALFLRRVQVSEDDEDEK